MKNPGSFLFFVILCHITLLHGQTATVTGVILNEANAPLVNVNISTKDNGTFSDDNGYYALHIIADQETTITFTHLGNKEVVLKNLILTTNEIYEFNPVMKANAIQVAGVTVAPTGEKNVSGIIDISPQDIRNIPGANAGVENILKLLPGVSSNNELSTQFAVRGGNYDENLVYVNEIEIYRPLLIRSAQQEGLSFVNSEMVRQVKFSAGGFQSKYGDKLSSVLDVTYKTPSEFGIQSEVSFLGAGTTIETVSKDKAFTSITGLRYRNNGLLVNSQQNDTNLNPIFGDVQSYLTYRFSKKFHLGFLGNVSLNHYHNEPLTKETNFGTIDRPQTLFVAYEGNENNKFGTGLAALKGTYLLNETITLKMISSIYHTTEEEHSDIIAHYELYGADTGQEGGALGQPGNLPGTGAQFVRRRNNLDALIFNLSHRGKYSKKGTEFQWGAKYTHEDIRDRLRESEFIDSAGIFIRPPSPLFTNDQPNVPFEAPIVPYNGVAAYNAVKTNRFSGFAQFSEQRHWNKSDIYYNIGLRAHYWTVSGTEVAKVSQIAFSPRVQFAIKPDWQSDILFRISGGIYQQPPFYRELRDSIGTVRPNVKAQRALHFVLGSEYSLILWNRPFTLIGETYYKKLNRVNPYTLEDVRIRYRAENNAEAYAYGAEVRMYGAFVPGTESWVSLGYLKTEENIGDRGNIARPTDQRLKVGVLFQDYVPTIPHLRMYLNLVYNTGVPGGSPSYADPYDFQHRLRDYKRADLGISYIFVGEDKTYAENHWLHKFKGLSAGIEIFNLFNNQNSITNTWVRDAGSKRQYAVPNFMTSRILNLKLNMRF